MCGKELAQITPVTTLVTLNMQRVAVSKLCSAALSIPEPFPYQRVATYSEVWSGICFGIVQTFDSRGMGRADGIDTKSGSCAETQADHASAACGAVPGFLHPADRVSGLAGPYHRLAKQPHPPAF